MKYSMRTRMIFFFLFKQWKVIFVSAQAALHLSRKAHGGGLASAPARASNAFLSSVTRHNSSHFQTLVSRMSNILALYLLSP